MQHQLILIAYGVLACISLIPMGILAAAVYSSGVIILRTMREAQQEIASREEERYAHELNARQIRRQPAYKMYVAGPGWAVAGYISRYFLAHAHACSSTWIKQAAIARYVASQNLLFAFPAWLAVISLHIAARLLYLSTFLLFLLFMPLYLLVLIVWSIFAQAGIIVLSLLDFFKTYPIILRCPYCYKEMPIATYLCPSCEAEHTRLWPSGYGLLAHRCIRCKTALPTLDRLGRDRLVRVCPACRHTLPDGIGDGAGIHIALVGATAAGKTSYLLMAMHELQQVYARYKITLSDATQRQHVEDTLRRLKRGQVPNATHEIAPHAYTLHLQPGSRTRKLLYLYDPSGEAFSSEIQASKQAYYKYCDGIVFVIDPLSIAAWVQKHQSPSSDQPHGSTLMVMQTYERLMTILELYVGMSKRYRQPIAVVVNKIDLFQLNNEIGLPAARVRMKYDPSTPSEADAISSLVRAFLCAQGLENLVRDLELHFAHVRYFSCSALGRTPTDHETRAFESDRALDPLLWLLKANKVL
jgi:GTPase SAR1 family protein